MTIDLRGSRKYLALAVVLLLVMGITLAVSFSPSKASNGAQQPAGSGKQVKAYSVQRIAHAARPTLPPTAAPDIEDTPDVDVLFDAPPPSGLPFLPGDEPVYATCRFRDPTAPQHSGLDFPLDAYTEIVSTQDGTVTFAGYDEIYGNLVIVKNPQWETRYAHNAYILARAGRSGAAG